MDQPGRLDALDALYDTTNALGLRSDLGQLLDEILELARQLTGSDNCALMLYEPAREELVVRRVRGYEASRDDVEQIRVAMGSGLSGRAAELRQPIRVGDVTKDPRYVPGLPDARSNLAVPLLVQNELVGVLNVEARRKDLFTEQHERLLTIMGTQAALAIVASRAKSHLEREIDQLNALYRISRLSVAETRFDAVVDSALAEVQRVTPEGECALLVAEGDHLVLLRTSAGYRSEAVGMRIPPGTGVTGRCAASAEVQLVPDVREDPDYISGVPGALSQVALPLTVHGRVIGVLNAEACEVGAFDEGHVRTLSVVAQQVAAVLEATRLREETERLAITDPLTGLYNRRYFQARLEQVLELGLRHDESVGLLIADIDHFKSVNDRFGHPVGDRVLQAFAASLKASLRASDLAARFGGEEFAVILHRAGPEGAAAAARQFGEKTAALRIEGPEGEVIPITVSIGVACFPDHAETSEGLVQQADAALYRAKNEGRNRVVLAAQ